METPVPHENESISQRLGLAFYEGYHGTPLPDYDEYGIVALDHRYGRAGIVAARRLKAEGLLLEEEADPSALVSVQVSEYLVAPADVVTDPHASDYSEELVDISMAFQLRVVHQGWGKWAVYKSSGRALNVDNTFDVESSSPLCRTQEYLDSHRFTRQEALERAQSVLRTMEVVGYTWESAKARFGPQTNGENPA